MRALEQAVARSFKVSFGVSAHQMASAAPSCSIPGLLFHTGVSLADIAAQLDLRIKQPLRAHFDESLELVQDDGDESIS